MSCENELKGEGFENLIKLCKESGAGMIRHCDKVIVGEKDCIIFDCNLQRIDCKNQVKPYEEKTDTIIAKDLNTGVCDLYKSTGSSYTDKGSAQYYDKKNPIQCPINGINGYRTYN